MQGADHPEIAENFNGLAQVYINQLNYYQAEVMQSKSCLAPLKWVLDGRGKRKEGEGRSSSSEGKQAKRRKMKAQTKQTVQCNQ